MVRGRMETGATGPSRQRSSRLVVRSISGSATRGIIEVGGLRVHCALGRSGRKARKREGDGATPVGIWRLSGVFWRPDRGFPPVTALPKRPIRPDDGWCDAPTDRNYNRRVRLPYPASAERLSRDDALYDLVVVLDYNIGVRRRGAGSAIFMHVARPGWLPTEGCIALAEPDLRRVLARGRRRLMLVVPR